ncbi:MAG: molybdopterin cofactor-binding domain-containing protein [Ilumatobacteraceae bacterium]
MNTTPITPDILTAPLERPGVDRRTFITRTALGIGGALVVGIQLDSFDPFTGAARAEGPASDQVLNAYVSIGTDESITLTCPGAEMGQGISTALPMILAEHMMVKWDNVQMVLGGADDALRRPTSATAVGTSQSSGGSNSVRSYYAYLRHLGTKVRLQMLTAATTYNGAAYNLSDLYASDGNVYRTSDNGLVASYGQLASAAAGVTTVSDSVVTANYVAPANFKIIGQPKPRLDIPAKVDGTAEFGLDVQLTGMKYAAVKLAPKIGQTVVSWTAPAGVVVVPLMAGKFVAGGPYVGVAVVHDRSSWDAMRAAASTTVTWQDAAYTASNDTALLTTKFTTLMATADPLATLPSTQYFVDSRSHDWTGDPLTDTTIAGTVHNATYSAPYVNHVTMEPMNATVRVDAVSGVPTGCEIWAPSQTQVSATSPGARDVAMNELGLTVDKVTMHTTFLGGGFGRRLKNDYVRYAVQVANHAAVQGSPVKVMWSREEDFTHDFHRPASMARFDAKVDGNKVVALKARVVGGRTSNNAVSAISSSAVDGISNTLYDFATTGTSGARMKVEWIDDQAEVPVASWRSVGNSQNCFFIESFMDELAAAKGVDPIDFRLANLDPDSAHYSRAVNVLNTVKSLSGWATAPASGRARGVALSMSFGDSICAQVAEVSGTPTSGFKVWKVTVVIDPFSVINPDTVKAQIEGAVIQGMSTAMFNAQILTQGAPSRRNFDTYRMARLNEAPVQIVTEIIQSDQAKKGGVGEPGLPPVAPAIANALAKLNGVRYRDLPLITATGGGGTPPPPPPSPAPTISKLEPLSGKVGAEVKVVGTNLGTVSAVKLAGVSCKIKQKASAELYFWVPKGAKTGKVTVTNPSGTATSGQTFTVTK